MRQSDLKQISQLRKLREDEEEKKLARARALLREAENNLKTAENERDQARQFAMDQEKRDWEKLSHSNADLATDSLETFYLKIAQQKQRIVELRNKVAELGKTREEAHTAIVDAQKNFFVALRNKDKWENFCDKIREEDERIEEIYMEEANSEVKLRPPPKRRDTAKPT